MAGTKIIPYINTKYGQLRFDRYAESLVDNGLSETGRISIERFRSDCLEIVVPEGCTETDEAVKAAAEGLDGVYQNYIAIMCIPLAKASSAALGAAMGTAPFTKAAEMGSARPSNTALGGSFSGMGDTGKHHLDGFAASYD